MFDIEDNLNDISSEIEKMLIEMSTSKENKILRECGKVVEEKMRNAIAVDTGISKRSIKSSLKSTEDSRASVTKVRAWYYGFAEWGTSKSKKNVGRLDRALRDIDSTLEDIVIRGLGF